MKSILYGLILITFIFANVFGQNDKKTDEIFKIIAPIREMETDVELNPDFQNNEAKLYAACIRLIIKIEEDALPKLEAFKVNNLLNLSKRNSSLIDENIELFKRFVDKWSSTDLFLKTAELNLQQQKYAEVFQFLKKAIEEENKRNASQSAAEKSKVASERYEQLKAKFTPVAFKYWDMDYKYFPKESKPFEDNNLRNEYIVGYVLDRGNFDRWDTLPYFIFRRAKLGEYSTLKEAIKTTAEKSNQPFTVLQNKKSGKMTVFAAVPNVTDAVNLLFASTEGAFPNVLDVKPTPNFKFDYEGTRMNFDRNVIMSQDNSSPDYKLIGIYDAKGLSVTTTTDFPKYRGTKAIQENFEQEISAKNFAEAKQSYLYFDRITSATPNLDIVKSNRRLMLLKIHRASPDLREFVEAEMARVNYTEADKKFVRGQ